MATIQLILNAVNNTSKALNTISADATACADRIDDLNGKIDLLSGAMDGMSDVADKTSGRLDQLALSSTAAAIGQETAAAAAGYLADQLDKASAAAATSGAAAGGAVAIYAGWLGVLSALTGRVTLFGGLLGNFMPGIVSWVHGWHIAADAVLEFIAVWVPAAIAVGAWAAAASQGVGNLYVQLTNMDTAVNASAGTVGKLGPLTGGFLALQNAVQPAVYEIFGDALTVVKNKAGELMPIVLGVSQVFEQLAARATAAIDSASMSEFLRNSVFDVSELGNAFGDVFGIIGNLMKAVPGYAQVLLTLGTAFLGLLEHVTAVLEPVLAIALALHGFILYVGLAVSGVVLLAGWLKTFGMWVLGGITDLVGWTVGVITAAGATDLWSAALAVLDAVNPMVWLALAVVAVAALTFGLVELFGTKTATQQWGAALQAALENLQTLGTTDVVSDQLQVAKQLNQAYSQLAKTQEYEAVANDHTGTVSKQVTQAYSDQLAKISQLKAIMGTLTTDYDTYNSHLQSLAKTYGGVANAEALLSAAGITEKQMLSTSASSWQQVQIQVEGAYNGMKTMGTYTGILGEDLQALNAQTTTGTGAVVSSITKVNEAWDTLVTNMTGSQNAFDTAQIAWGTLITDWDKGKNSIDALTTGGVAMNQEFETQISNIEQLYDNWRLAGVSNNLFIAGVKASIAPLVQYAKGSQEATDQLTGLAQEAGYQGPAALTSLTKWLGNTGNAATTLKNVTNQATQQEALLTSAMNAQGQTITSQLIGDINEAILKYDGVTQAAQKYGQAIAQDGAASTQAQSARTALINDLIKSGTAAHDSTAQIAAMITKITGIPTKKALEIVMNGEGAYSVTGSSLSSPAANLAWLKAEGAATGGYISGPGTKTSDSIPAYLSVGEYVVRASSVDKYGKHVFDALNAQRFASGGLVDAGNTSVLSGQQAVTDYNSFGSKMTAVMIADMRQAMEATYSGVPGDVASYQNVIMEVLSLLHQPMADLSVVLKQMTTESGGNPTAVNRSDSNWAAGTPSVGLMQVIGPTFRQYAGPYAAVGPFAYGVSENPLANIFAALNYAIHRYGPNWTSVLGQGHGYLNGGIIAEPVLGIGLNSGSPYSFAENGVPETVVPGANSASARNGPLFTIQGDLVVRDEADATLISQRLSGLVRMASLGGGVRL